MKVFSPKWSAVGLVSALILSVFAWSVLGQKKKNPDFHPRRLLAPQPIISDAPFKTVAELDGEMNPTELVLGVTIGKESRAYPINMLTGPRREIVNDKIGNQHFAATW